MSKFLFDEFLWKIKNDLYFPTKLDIFDDTMIIAVIVNSFSNQVNL